MRVYPELTVDGEFKALGDLGFTGALNDRQFSFLRNRGFTNSLTDMFGQYRSWTPTELFNTAGSRGFFYDFSDYSTQFQDTAGTTPVTGVGQSLARVNDKSGLGNHATQATAGSRALTQVRPMFTQRNRAVGSELPENNFYWLASATVNGITYTRVATGIDTDGLPYADYSVVGTATSDSFFEAQNATTQRIPAATGQTWTVSMIARRLSGAAPGAGEGVFPYIRGETAPTTSTEFSALTYNPANAETVLSSTFTLANAATNQIRSAVSFRVASGSTANYTMRVKAFQLELGSARTTYQPAVSGELRNRAIGSGDVGNATYWPNTATANGITSTKVASGTDIDGLPYVDVRYTGTATATFHDMAYNVAPSRSPASIGQAWTSSVTVRRIGGSITGVSGITVSAVEETAPFTFVNQAAATETTATADTLLTATRTIASGNQARTAVVLVFTNGATIDVTYRIKGLQLEQASTYSRYQRTITANEWYEPGFTSYRGIQFDGVDDFLQTAAIDFAGAESLGPELVTNGDFATGNLTGWVELHSAPSTVSVVSGVATWSTDGVNSGRIRQSFVTTVGRAYKVSCSGAGVSVAIGTTAGGTEVVGFGTNNARPTFTFVATSTLTWFNTATATNGATLDNVSVKEVLIPADKMTVVAGVRKLSDAARAVLVELGAPAAAGSFRIEAPGSSLNNYAMASGGSTIVGTTAAGFSSPISSVLSGLGDISGDNVALRHNGTQVASSPSDQGTGNFANDIVYIGRRGGSTLPFNGIITFLCVINRTLTASELAQLEAFANGKTGAY